MQGSCTATHRQWASEAKAKLGFELDHGHRWMREICYRVYSRETAQFERASAQIQIEEWEGNLSSYEWWDICPRSSHPDSGAGKIFYFESLQKDYYCNTPSHEENSIRQIISTLAKGVNSS